MTQSFSAKDPAEVIVLSFDFTQLLDAGETISACSFSSLDKQRNKNVTTDMIQGAADISADPIVKQKVTGGVDGHSYLIRAQVTLSSSRVLVGPATLPVRIGAE